MNPTSARHLREQRKQHDDTPMLTGDMLLIVSRQDEDGRSYAITLGELKAWLHDE